MTDSACTKAGKKICDVLAWPSRGAVEKLTAFYDEATIQLVREIFARDFELFGYSQSLSDAAASPGV